MQLGKLGAPLGKEKDQSGIGFGGDRIKGFVLLVAEVHIYHLKRKI